MENNKKYITVDNIQVPIENERNVLELIRKANIELPTFCYHSELSVHGACRLCVADIDGNGIQATCSIVPRDGMVIKTNTPEVRQIRKVNLELILANHEVSCPTCARSNNCKLQDLTRKLGVDKSRFRKTNKTAKIDDKSYSIVHDPNKCVLCGDCVRACKEIQTVGAIDFVKRGAETIVGPAYGKSLAEVECVNCGQCVSVCPVGALTAKPEKQSVWDDIFDAKKTVVVQIAPAVRVALGEEFGLEPGTVATGQLVAALKRVGFDQVYDTSFAADLTVIEEATEFIRRLDQGEKMPQFTSCCPAWVKFIEQYYPELLPNLSTCRSPQQMFGSLAKKILPGLLGVEKEDLVVVSIMPCTAKKYEAKRPEFNKDIADVDHVLTTTEISKMIAETGLQFNKLQPESFDLPMGFKTGAGVIFGNSGGVSEAVLRFAYEKITGENLVNYDFKATRGNDGVREVPVNLNGKEIKLGIIHSLKNARAVCEDIKAGRNKYDLIEVMACPGGCINGGGQPVSFDPDYKEKRKNGLYGCDKQLQLHKSQENPYIKEVYQKVLGETGGELAHNLLHTHYRGKKRINDQDISLRNSQKPKVEVSACVGTNCFLKGSQQLLKELMVYVSQNKLENLVGFEGIDEMVEVKATFCFEKCDRGPVVRINQIVLENATFEKAKEILDKEIKRVGNMLISKDVKMN